MMGLLPLLLLIIIMWLILYTYFFVLGSTPGISWAE
jgi:uncharacterized RDD family membrane protein YckC